MISHFEKVGHLLFREKVDNDEIEDLDESFVGQFLINGTVRQPIESMMIPTASIKQLTENIRNNKTYCFKTDPGPFGWCATCKGIKLTITFFKIMCR